MLVSVIPNMSKAEAISLSGEILKKLSEYNIDSIADASLINLFPCERYGEGDELYKDVDVAIVIGGDGTILSAAYNASKYDVPILGYNLGHIGYLSELEPNELFFLRTLPNGGYELDIRMMLDVSVKRNDEEVFETTALNEIVTSKGGLSKITGFDINCDGGHVCKYRSDAVIISTPTGSTAYSMAAGGPIIDPRLNSFCLCPVCSHTLSVARPIIFSRDSVIDIIVHPSTDTDLWITADGSRNFRLSEGDKVSVSCSKLVTKLIRMKDRSFYDILYKKLFI